MILTHVPIDDDVQPGRWTSRRGAPEPRWGESARPCPFCDATLSPLLNAAAMRPMRCVRLDRRQGERQWFYGEPLPESYVLLRCVSCQIGFVALKEEHD